jgi:hypothetical protein
MDGSDDLFGGLPAVSNAENLPSSVAAAISNTVDADHRPKPAPADDGKKSSGKHAAGGGLSSSLVSSLGTAGTAMVSLGRGTSLDEIMIDATSRIHLRR